MAAVDGLTHLDADGRARMVDVGGKPVTARTATASGRLETTPEVLALLRDDAMPKADALATARIAGIMAAKRTSELIPLCHGIPVDAVAIDFDLGASEVGITATASTSARTGVEMEALTAVAVAGLTLHDMIKAVDPAAAMQDLRLETKTGGSRGDWSRAGGRAAPQPGAPAESSSQPPTALRLDAAAVVVASTRAADGTRDDTTGPVISDWLERRGLRVDPVAVVADADVASAIEAALAARPAVLITTGGTGLGPGDRTPEATIPLLDHELPGVAEAIRARGMQSTPTAALSRAVAGVARGTLVVNVAGSAGAVRDALGVLDDILDHLLRQLAGDADHG